MTEREKLILKAKKVAALMSSPVEGEMLAASAMLKKLLDEHNLTMQDLGMAKKSTHTHHSSSTPTSHSNGSSVVIAEDFELNLSDIIEVHYKYPGSELAAWITDLISTLARLYEVEIVFSYEHVKILGFPSDVEVFKHVLVFMRRHIEDNLSKHRYTSPQDISGYYNGLMDRFEASVMAEVSLRNRNLSSMKMSMLAHYVNTHFNIRKTMYMVPLYSSESYATGSSDGSNFRAHRAIGRS